MANLAEKSQFNEGGMYCIREYNNSTAGKLLSCWKENVFEKNLFL